MGSPVSLATFSRKPSILGPPETHAHQTHRPPPKRHTEEADATPPTGSFVAYTDASCTDKQLVTPTVVPGHQNLCANCLHLLRTQVPSLSAELLALRDATHLLSAASASSQSLKIIPIDYTAAIKEIRKVYNAHPFADEIHRITAQMPGKLRIQWIPWDTISAHIQSDTASRVQ
ncbi:hypothetical protein HPB52_016352 [Rhipicephalus sanguineus]|uniref:Uncharacterized protein n=1 Tax=Rhipicephalus sanguineus TaxID=34632 RepID=A0A9D4Q0Z4_RHISA|nr:hypothetical protein HPB52_016352 [Rhipicephalus sanguineus]